MRKKLACVALALILTMSSHMAVFAGLGENEPKAIPFCCETVVDE